MKDKVKGFAAGVLFCAVGFTTAYAAGGISSAEFNANNITFNGVPLDLSSAPMISVVKEAETDASNYMPLRAVLEQMGFQVDWDGDTKTVVVKDRELTALGQQVLDNITEVYGDFTETDGYLFLQEAVDMLKEEGIDDAMMSMIIVEDYHAYLNGDESLISELWTRLFTE